MKLSTVPDRTKSEIENEKIILHNSRCTLLLRVQVLRKRVILRSRKLTIPQPTNSLHRRPEDMSRHLDMILHNTHSNQDSLAHRFTPITATHLSRTHIFLQAHKALTRQRRQTHMHHLGVMQGEGMRM